MKKIVALPLLLAIGLAVSACAKHDASQNLSDGNVVLNDETGPDNFTATDDLVGNNAADANTAAPGNVAHTR